jgi:endonuclease/exonuclease/phosphatase family metal-dependent hydrolase
VVRVMTFNIHHGGNMDGVYSLEGIAEVIRAVEPDVVALQEVDRRWGARSELEDQPARLSEMTGMAGHFGAALEQEGGEYGNLILSRLPMSERSVMPLPRLGEGSEQRCVVSARVEAEGGAVRFYCTHLQHNSAPERAAQARAVLELMTRHGEPCVLAGDFNAQPGDEELEVLMRGLTDAWAAASGEPGHTIPSTGPAKRIDFVFTSREMRVVGARVVQTRASDHLPVAVELELPARG